MKKQALVIKFAATDYHGRIHSRNASLRLESLGIFFGIAHWPTMERFSTTSKRLPTDWNRDADACNQLYKWLRNQIDKCPHQ